MTRSKGRWFAACVLGLLALGVVTTGAKDADTTGRRPNILIVLTDDQRDGMRFLPEVRSFFGDGGTRFTRGFANTPLCCPARATLMTGQYPHNHGVWTNKEWEDLDPENTLQHDLQAAGYKTAIFGKYLNLFPVESEIPPGFDRFAVFRSGGEGSDYYSGGMWNVDGSVRRVDTYTSRVLQEEGVRFIHENKDEPWLLILSVPAPHSPFTAEARYANARVGPWAGNPAVSERDRSDKPPWVSSFNEGLSRGRAIRAKQLRTLMSVDDMMGAVSSALETTGQAGRTVAFFTNDNGYLWGEHGMVGKPSPYMPSIQVPFYVRWPGRLGAGDVARRLVSHIDITATAYDAAGVTPEHKLDGHSLVAPHRRERLVTEMMVPARGKAIPPWTSMLTAAGDHYIEYRSGGKVVFRELYELDRDPWELHNVAPARPDKVARLSALLSADALCSGRACP